MNRMKKATTSRINSLPNQRTIQLQQIANCVIDAYLNRNQRYAPEFGEHTEAILYLERPNGSNAPEDLVAGHWYEKADFEKQQ